MKRVLCALFQLCLCSTALAKERVTITYFDIPPHVIYDPVSKQVSGAVVDLLEYLAPEWGVELVWDPTPANIPRQMQQLERGERNVAAVFIYNPADLAKFSYSEKPYFLAKDGLLVKKGNPLEKIGKVDDIATWKIGYAPETYLSEFMRDKRITWDNNASPDFSALNVKKLLDGRIDAAYAPDHAALLYARRAIGAEKELRMLYTPQPAAPLCLGFSLKSAELKRRFDEVFARKDGARKYAELLARYIGAE